MLRRNIKTDGHYKKLLRIQFQSMKLGLQEESTFIILSKKRYYSISVNINLGYLLQMHLYFVYVRILHFNDTGFIVQ